MNRNPPLLTRKLRLYIAKKIAQSKNSRKLQVLKKKLGNQYKPMPSQPMPSLFSSQELLNIDHLPQPPPKHLIIVDNTQKNKKKTKKTHNDQSKKYKYFCSVCNKGYCNKGVYFNKHQNKCKRAAGMLIDSE